MSTGPKKIENRGGARTGAGRKPITLSQNQIKKMLRKANQYKKQYGKEVDEVLLDFVYGVPQVITIPEHIQIVALKDENGEVVGRGATKVPEHEIVDVPKVRERQAAIKIFKDFTMAKVEEGGASDTAGPEFYLPETDPDPASNVVHLNKDEG